MERVGAVSHPQWRYVAGAGRGKIAKTNSNQTHFSLRSAARGQIATFTEVVTVQYFSLVLKLRACELRAHAMTTVVFSIQHAGAPKLEEIVVEVHPEWAPIGAQCVRPATTT